jgi:DHA1 family inner membrane transport protein
MQTSQLTKPSTAPLDPVEHTPYGVRTLRSAEAWQSSRAWPSLVLLAVGTFTVGTSELMIAGILPLLATDFDVSVVMAGWLVTGYALAFAIVTPLVAVRTGRLPRRPVLFACLVAFVVGNLIAVVAPSFGVLLLARAGVAVVAGVFEVVATATAAALVPERQRGRAIALVVAGFSVALVVGVPAGTLIGLVLGWRAAFGVLAALGIGAALGLRVVMPGAVTTNHGGGPGSVRDLLRQPAARTALLTTGLVFTGAYTACTYIAPFVEDVTGLSGQSVAGVLLLIGVTSSVGNVVGGLGTDRVGPPRMLLASCVTLAASLAAFSVFGGWAPGVLVTVGMWGLTLGVFVPTQQSRLVALAPAGVDVGLALNLSALSVGMALGAAVGGAVIEHGGLAALGHVGAAIITLALAGLVRQRARAEASFRCNIRLGGTGNTPQARKGPC